MADRTPLLYDDSDDASTLGPASSAASIAHNTRQRNVTRYISFISAVLSCLCAGSLTAFSLYGHLFQERLQYTQLQVNIVAIAASLSMYLPVPLLGYLCDRNGPAPLSFASAILFGVGYMLAAFTYRSGARQLGEMTHERGWPFAIMVLAFVAAGMATSCMYLSAVTTCAKNFGRGKYRGLALACPIAAFGLSGMWQSQVGSRLLYERKPDGTSGDVDVFKLFMFLAVTLLVVGLLGTVGLEVVDEEELIDEAVEELERSGLLEGSDFFQRGRATSDGSYGSFATTEEGSEDDTASARRAADAAKARKEEEARKKTWLLNGETRRFLKDHTMWWLAGGFFLVTGPGETFINNLGTIIGTLYPPPSGASYVPTIAATHISIVAITSTVARLFTGTLYRLTRSRPRCTSLSHICKQFFVIPSSSGRPLYHISCSLSSSICISFVLGTNPSSIWPDSKSWGTILDHFSSNRFWLRGSLQLNTNYHNGHLGSGEFRYKLGNRRNNASTGCHGLGYCICNYLSVGGQRRVL